jgi:nucleoside-diphosphate-sugar epimerase
VNVFLTGSTGFLGGELAVLLSKRPQVRRIYCLIRANDEPEARERLRQVFDFHGDALDESRIIPVVGDLKDCALAEKLSQFPELKEIGTVIHSAADTSFASASAESVQKVNIGGTGQILAWARSLPNLQTFLYVGTASICGTNLVNRHIHEDESPNVSATHLVKYCHTKMMGEILVSQTIPHEKLLIVRPSIIMGDSRDWKPRSYVILWALAAVNAIRLIPANPQSNLDIIPVDYTAEAIAELLFSKRRWTTYHVSAGQASATNLEKVLGAVSPPSDGRPPIRFVSHELLSQMRRWPKRLKAPSELFSYGEYLTYWGSTFNGHLRILLAGMQPYFRFMELNQTFDNSRLLADTSLGPPPPPHEYVGKSEKYLDDIDLTEGALDP